MSRAAPLALLLLLAACTDKDGGTDDGRNPPGPRDSGAAGADTGEPSGDDGGTDSGADTDTDTDTDTDGGHDGGDTGSGSGDTGAGGDTGEPPPPAFAVTTALGAITPDDPELADPGVLVHPNLDDDDGDGLPDWLAERAGDDDRATVEVSFEGDLTLALAGDLGDLRVWRERELLLDAGTTSASFGPDDSPLLLEVEAATYRVLGELTVDDSATGESLSVAITGAPLILNHHLQASTDVLATEISAWGLDNTAFIEGFEEELGEAFTAVSYTRYADIWMQDELEFATATTADSQLDVIIDSIRDGQYGPGYGLDPLPEDLYLGDGWSVGVWGSGLGSSQDYFGNLEVSPPVTVDGVEYPFGRIYYGRSGRLVPHLELREFLDAQAVQAPFELDVSWLCVGHVDEFFTTVPDPDARLGWKLVYTDTDLAWEIIDELDPSERLTRYARSAYKPWDTVGDLQDDTSLRSLNRELQEDHLDPNLDTLVEELGLTDEDIVFVPGLFETVTGCRGTTAAAFPGMVNLTVADATDGTTTLFVADPYLREDLADVESDPVAQAFADAMPAGLAVKWLDDWSTYHLNLGEVHCGSNVARLPADGVTWWEDAAHLLD